jgi:hypothetical protein
MPESGQNERKIKLRTRIQFNLVRQKYSVARLPPDGEVLPDLEPNAIPVQTLPIATKPDSLLHFFTQRVYPSI